VGATNVKMDDFDPFMKRSGLADWAVFPAILTDNFKSWSLDVPVKTCVKVPLDWHALNLCTSLCVRPTEDKRVDAHASRAALLSCQDAPRKRTAVSPPCIATPKGGEAQGARVAYQERASTISAQPTYCTQGRG